MQVRVWLILTLAIALAAGYVTALRVHQALDDRWLIQNGVRVQAKIISANGSTLSKRWLRSEPIPARLSIGLPGREPVEMDAWIEPRPNSYLTTGETLAVKVDPNNPERWTESETPVSWAAELVVPAMLLPVLLILLAITLLRRRRVLKTWETEPLSDGVVVEIRHSAAAPMSRLIRFSLAEGNDPRIFSLLYPPSLGVPKAGDLIPLICPTDRPDRALPARAYVSRTESSPSQNQ